MKAETIWVGIDSSDDLGAGGDCHPAIQELASLEIVGAPVGRGARGGQSSLMVDANCSEKLYWAKSDSGYAYSLSQASLARLTNRTVDRSALLVSLCGGLPYSMRNRSVWAGVGTIFPGQLFDPSMPDVGVEFIDPEAVSNDYDRKAVTSSLRAALESATARPSLQGKAAGCDLSGGLDSTSIAYLLDRQGIALSLAHDVCPDPRNDDYDYARIAANDLGRPIDQLGDTRTDRDAFDAVFGGNQAGLDEAIPTWIGFGGRATRYSTYAQTSGYSDHFIGLGSDDLFSGHFSAVAEIARSSRVPEAKRALERYRIAARASKRELRKFLSSEVSYGDSLRAAVSDLRNGVDADIRISSLLGWCPGLRVNSVLSAEATTKVFEEIDLAARTTAPLDARANIHVMKSCLLTQADLVRSLNATFGSSDFRFNAPFLDSGLVELISSLPSIAFLGSDTSKPLLVDAMEGILPESIRLRRSKPDFNQDVFTDFQRNRERLRTEFRASILGEMGIIDVDKVCEIIDNDFVTIRQIDDMLAAYNTEKWLRNIDDGWVFDGSGLG